MLENNFYKKYYKTVTPTRAIEILGKNIIYKDDENHIYQIKVINQGTNECWMHSARNAFFLTAMFSGVTELEFNMLYNDMLNKKKFDVFVEELKKDLLYKTRIEKHEEGRLRLNSLPVLTPNGLPVNSINLVPNIGENGFTGGEIDDSFYVYQKKFIIEAETKTENDASNLAKIWLSLLISEEGKFGLKIRRLHEKLTSYLGIEMSISYSSFGHGTTLVICRENDTYYYFFADSYSSYSPNGLLDQNIKLLKRFIEEKNFYLEMKLRIKVYDVLYRGFFNEDDFNELMDDKPLLKLDLFKNTYKPFLKKQLAELLVKKVANKDLCTKIENALKTLGA